MTALAGVTAAVLIFGRMIFQPGPNEYISLKFGIFFAFLMAIGIAVGGYLVMQDEGTTFDRSGDSSVRWLIDGRRATSAPSAPRSGGPPA